MSTADLIWRVIFVASLFASMGAYYAAHRISSVRRAGGQPPNRLTRLQVYSAFYGTDKEEEDALPELEKAIGADSINVLVSNNLVSRDPVPGIPKRLRVAYSYGSQPQREIIRRENERLVLPEDPFLLGQVERLTKEMEDAKPAVVFGDAIQGVNTAQDPDASWWHVPITALSKLDDCIVDAEINSRRFQMLWSVRHGEDPRRRTNLRPNEPEVVAIILRSERLRWGLAYEPWTAFVTDEDVMQRKYHDYSKLRPGTHGLKVLLKTGERIYSCAYEIIVPDGEIGNGHFYIRHYDGLESPV